MSYEIFDMLCKDAGVTAYRVGVDTGIDRGTLSHWKRGDYEPKFDKRKKIADYFGVTVEYLDSGITNDPVLIARQKMRDDVKGLADLAAKADPEQVKMATAFLKTIMKSK